MGKIKFVSLFVLLALLLSVSPGAVLAKEPPPELQTPERFTPVGESFTSLRGCGANTPPASPFASPTPAPPAPDSYEHCDWVWVVDECFPGYVDGACAAICEAGCSWAGGNPLACLAGCAGLCYVPSYCTGHWEWFCA